MDCTEVACLIDINQINIINYGRLSWTAENYSKFWGEPLENGKFWLGTGKPGNLFQYLDHSIPPTNGSSLPTSFTITTNEIGRHVINQGPCQTSFERSLLHVLEDRDYISKRKPLGDYSKLPGLTWNCKTGKAEKNVGKVWNSLWQSGSIYRPFHLTHSEDIMHEIFENGPVQATMKVFQDFFVYKNGIYQHKIVPGEQPLGYHSVRVIGWGEELAVNSWSRQWGDNGLFRVLIGGNECEFESHVIAN